jgi:hypothetical protein
LQLLSIFPKRWVADILSRACHHCCLKIVVAKKTEVKVTSMLLNRKVLSTENQIGLEEVKETVRIVKSWWRGFV